MSEPGNDEHNTTDEHDDDGLIERMRDSGVGVEDPNIVGDVGPTDVPPGGPDPDHEIGDEGAEV